MEERRWQRRYIGSGEKGVATWVAWRIEAARIWV
jgi:hypothetical protein